MYTGKMKAQVKELKHILEVLDDSITEGSNEQKVVSIAYALRVIVQLSLENTNSLIMQLEQLERA